MTIKSRLTLWGMLITSCTCLVVCAVVYAGLDYSLRSEVDGFLEGEVEEFTAILHAAPHVDLNVIQRDVRRELGSRSRDDLAFRLRGADGALLLSSRLEEELPASWHSAIPQFDPAQHWFDTVTQNHADVDIRVCSKWIDIPHHGRCIAQATYRLDRVAASLRNLLTACVAALALAVGLSYIGSRYLATRSLLPVDTIVGNASQIHAGRLSDRIPASGNGDELDRLATTLNDMLARIEVHLRQMRQFTADAAHELRTPLAALRGTAEVALTTASSEADLRRVVEDSIQQYDHLSKIANDLLLLAQLDAGEANLEFRALPLEEAVRDVVDLYTPFALDHGITLSSDADTVTVTADKGRLRQVLCNLVDNAIKFTSGPGRVEIIVQRIRGQARVVVADTGPGIPDAELPHVFDRFYRMSRSRSPGGKGRGVGLGLPISRSIIAAHRGTLTLENRVEGGLAATIILPAQGDTPPEQPRKDAPRTEQSAHP